MRDVPAVATSAGVTQAPDALWLLRPKWQMARHRMARHERGDVRRMLTVGVLGGGFWLTIFFLAFRLVRYFRSAADIGTLLSGKMLSMVLLSFGSILLLSNTIAALSNFFLARDLDQLSAAPVSPWAIYRARLTETTVHSSWMVALLLLPIIAAYGAAFDAGWGFALVATAAVLPFLVIPGVLGTAATLVLVNVFPARRTRDVLSVVTALAVAGLVVMLRAARPEQLARPEAFKDFMQFVAALDTPSSPWLPSEWLSETLMRYVTGDAVWQPLIRLWGVAALFAVAGGALHARGWRRGFSQAQEGANKRSATDGRRPWLDRSLGFLGATRRELVLKELKVFARDSTQWSQLIMLAVLMVVYVSNVRYLPLNGEGMTAVLRNVIPFLNLALAGFVLASIAARFVFPSISLEGRTWWLLRSSPLPMREVLWAKFWVGAVPLLVLAAVLVGATNSMLGVRPFVQVVSLTAIVALVFPLTALALAFGTFYPRFDTENAAQIPTSFGGLVFMMSGVTLIGAVAYLTGRPAARYVVSEHFGRSFDQASLVAPFAGALALCVAATVIPLVLARQRLEGVERE